MTINLTKKEIKKICNVIDDTQINTVKTFVIFLGHAHSGHSIVGAILDAHKQTAISNEINIPKLIVDHKLRKEEIEKITLSFSLNKSDLKGWLNTGYLYNVENGYQGKTKYPKVLGDKKGGGSTRVIRNNPEVLTNLVKIFGKKLKFINVVRNPYDNIAAFSHYWKEPLGMQHVIRYYENLETNIQIEKKYPKQFFKINHQNFLKNPKIEYIKLLRFLNLKVNKEQVESSVSIVRKEENKRSNKITWPKNISEEIKKQKKLINYDR